MKKSSQRGRVLQDSGQPALQQPDKVGWIRKFCGRGIFRELWRNRFVVLRGDQLYISDKEVKDERRAQEVLDLLDYERSEELRKAKSRSKKNHSRFTLLRCRQPGSCVPNLVFLAVSPEEKESWVNALNVAIIKAKNRILDEVTLEEDGALVHPTRDRAKIPHGRRLPTRGHLMAVASTSSHGTLTLDLVAEEDGFSPDYEGDSRGSWENFQLDLQRGGSCGRVGSWGVGVRQRSGTDVSKLRANPKEPKVKTSSLPRGSELSWGKQSYLEASKVHKTQQMQVLKAQSQTPQPGKRFSMQGRSRCASMDEVLSSRPAMIRSELRSALRRCPTEEETGGGASVQPVGQLQSLIAQRMQKAQELLEEMRLQELQKAKAERERGGSSPYLKGIDSPRLHHLRGSDSPHSSRSSGSPRSRSSDSPRLRGKDSPRLRGRESPRSKAKRTRSRGADSPRSRGSQSPAAKATDSPRPRDSPRLADSPRAKSSDAFPSPKPDKTSCGSSGPREEDDAPVHKSLESPPSRGGSASSRTEGPASSRTEGPASSRTEGPASSQTEGPASSRTEGPASSRTGGPASSRTGGPASSQTEGSASSRTGGSASSRTEGPASSRTGGPASPVGSDPVSPRLGSSRASPSPKNSASFSGSFESRSPASLLPEEDPEVERRRGEAERLLREAVSSWKEAQEVLQEVKALQSRTLRRQRRRTYEKTEAAAEEATPTSPTTPEDDDESP